MGRQSRCITRHPARATIMAVQTHNLYNGSGRFMLECKGHAVVPLLYILTQPCWCPALLDVHGSPAVFHFMEYLFFTRPSRCPIHMGLDNDGDKYDPPEVKVSSPGVKVSSPSGVAQCVAQGDQRDCGS